VGNTQKKLLEGWTFFLVGNLAHLNDRRRGQLILRRE